MIQADLTFTVELEENELQALRLAADGLDDEVIAARMGISFDGLREIFGGLFLATGKPVNLATMAHDGFLTIAARHMRPIKVADRKKAVGA